MDKKEHNKLIAKIARLIFKPYGIFRKGQSRIWLDDNSWYTTVIEFQPSSWSRGSYLNIGVNFHWFNKEYYSYDIGGRIKPFQEFSNPEDFELTITEYCKEALNEVDTFRRRLKDKEEALIYILETQTTENIWGNFHLGIINALNNKNDIAEEHFKLILENEMTWDWVLNLKGVTKDLLAAMNNNFAYHITKICLSAREQKKLPIIENSEIMKIWA